jgi:DNA-binding NtrC family response regulator
MRELKLIESQRDMTLDAVERRHILRVLDSVRGDKVRAAQILGINLSTVYRKLARYQLEDEWERQSAHASPRAAAEGASW